MPRKAAARAQAGITIRQNWHSFHIPAPHLLDSGFRRAATGVLGSLFQTLLYHLRPVGVPSRRIQDILSINDDGVLFWLFVILSACYGQGFSRNTGSPHLK